MVVRPCHYREDRRHIATLFSLEAAESIAQKTRLQEQLKATSPFRLAELGCSSSSSQSEGIEISAPPGKSKRRQRSTLLENIVREHDWEDQEQLLEDNIHIYADQQGAGEDASESESPPPLIEDNKEWEAFASDGDLKGEATVVVPAGTGSPHTIHKESPKSLEAERPGLNSSKRSGEHGTEDIPGSFDAVWGRSDRSAQSQTGAPSKDSQSDDENDHRELYSADSDDQKIRRMADFLGISPLHSIDRDGMNEGTSRIAFAEDASISSSSERGNAQDDLSPALSPERLEVDGIYEGVTMLRLGDPTEWEVRFSTDDCCSNSPCESPFNNKEPALLSTPEADGELYKEYAGNEPAELKEVEQAEERKHYTQGVEPSGQLPEVPPSLAGPLSQERNTPSDQSRMNSYSSAQLVYINTSDKSRPPAESGAVAVRVTSELHHGAALAVDTRLNSLQSVKSDDLQTSLPVTRRCLSLALQGQKVVRIVLSKSS